MFLNFFWKKIQGIGSKTIQSLSNKNTIELAEKELDYINKNKIEYSYFLDEDYPENLQHCIDAPILIFKDGKF